MQQTLRRWLLWTVPLILALGVSPGVSADDDVSSKFRVRGKLRLSADALRQTLTLVSPEQGFAVGLPYSESWTFDVARESLGASDERLTLDIRPRKRDEGDPWSQLDAYLDELVVSRADLRFPQLVEEEDRQVVCVQVRNGEGQPWRWLYWTVIPSDGGWLQLTLIDTETQELEPYDLDLVDLIASGFTTIETEDRLAPQPVQFP